MRGRKQGMTFTLAATTACNRAAGDWACRPWSLEARKRTETVNMTCNVPSTSGRCVKPKPCEVRDEGGENDQRKPTQLRGERRATGRRAEGRPDGKEGNIRDVLEVSWGHINVGEVGLPQTLATKAPHRASGLPGLFRRRGALLRPPGGELPQEASVGAASPRQQPPDPSVLTSASPSVPDLSAMLGRTCQINQTSSSGARMLFTLNLLWRMASTVAAVFAPQPSPRSIATDGGKVALPPLPAERTRATSFRPMCGEPQ